MTKPKFIALVENPPPHFLDPFGRCWWGKIINNRWDWHFDFMPLTTDFCWCLPHDVAWLPARITAADPPSAAEPVPAA